MSPFAAPGPHFHQWHLARGRRMGAFARRVMAQWSGIARERASSKAMPNLNPPALSPKACPRKIRIFKEQCRFRFCQTPHMSRPCERLLILMI
jgi:hypothetical protein